MNRTIAFRKDGKFIGRYDYGSRTFSKFVEYRKHYLHSYSAWAIESKVVSRLGDLGCEYIVIVCRDKDDIYKTSYDNFLSKSFKIDFGYGEQLALAEKYWQIVNEGQILLFGGEI